MARLEDVIPNPSVRKPIYQIFAGLGLALTATQVGFAAVEDAGQPVWLTVALSIYAFLASAGFVVAQANTVQPTVTVTSGNLEDLDKILDELPGKHSK